MSIRIHIYAEPTELALGVSALCLRNAKDLGNEFPLSVLCKCIDSVRDAFLSKREEYLKTIDLPSSDEEDFVILAKNGEEREVMTKCNRLASTISHLNQWKVNPHEFCSLVGWKIFQHP